MTGDDIVTSGSTIAHRVTDALQADQALGRFPISISDQGATVTLTGQVGSQQDKEAAERLARINSLSTYHVLDAASKLGIRKAIIASSETTAERGGGDAIPEENVHSPFSCELKADFMTVLAWPPLQPINGKHDGSVGPGRVGA